jgi:uncharacterized membrane protein YecN with MAPEG domain
MLMTTTLPLITAFWAGLVGLLGLVLALNVVRLRQKLRVGLGDGSQPELTRAMRVFGNFAEYTALCLVMIALLDMLAGPRWLIHACGAALFIGRAAHAWGLAGSSEASVGRAVGMALTWLVILVTGVSLVWAARGAVL